MFWKWALPIITLFYLLWFSPQSDDALATFFLNMFETELQVEAQSDQVGFFVAVVIVVVVVWGV